MKQAPLLALRWRPRDSTGSRSGAVLSLSGTGTPQVIDRPCIHYAPPWAIAPQTAQHLFADRAEGPVRWRRDPPTGARGQGFGPTSPAASGALTEPCRRRTADEEICRVGVLDGSLTGATAVRFGLCDGSGQACACD